MLRWLYTLLFYLFIPFILLRLFWRGFRAPTYWQRWSERFGFFPTLAISKPLWIHAVSMGEVQAAIPLVRSLQIHFPTVPIFITTMTPTGSQRVRAVFGQEVWHVYLPYDLPGAMTRLLVQVKPRLLILMETELWPNLLQACQRHEVPIILANARLSVHSAAGYRWIARLMRNMLAQLTVIAAQTASDAQRFIQLGADRQKVQVTGSLKFDIRLPDNVLEQAQILRTQWGKTRAVWIAASTHEGEETLVLEAFQQLKPEINHLLLVLVPRHPERFNRVATLCLQRGFMVVRRSENGVCQPETEIYLADTMGELPLLYAACDVAFVGGSLVPIGGHNLLEPAAVSLPVIMGPYVFECAEICHRLLAVQAGQQVNHATQLAEVVKLYLSDENLRQQTGHNGRQFVEQNQGALEKMLKIVEKYMVSD